MKKAIVILLLVILLGIFGFSAWQLWSTLREYREGENVYTQMDQYISIPETVETTGVTNTRPEDSQQSAREPEVPEEPAGSEWPVVDFETLRQINPDVIGWIYIPDTKINYPIVQGQDNDKYLHRLITGEYNSSGSIFLDAWVNADFSCQNSPIYGHNMKNGSMFAGILQYREQSFLDNHPVALLMTPQGNYTVRLFAAYMTDSWDDAWETVFTEEDFSAWLQRLQRRSYVTADAVPTTKDRILTFSTCAYDMDNARFLVHGILEKEEKKA